MKKIYFAIAACALFAFAACNGGGSSTDGDTTKKADSPTMEAPVTPPMDTTKKMDDTAAKADKGGEKKADEKAH